MLLEYLLFFCFNPPNFDVLVCLEHQLKFDFREPFNFCKNHVFQVPNRFDLVLKMLNDPVYLFWIALLLLLRKNQFCIVVNVLVKFGELVECWILAENNFLWSDELPVFLSEVFSHYYNFKCFTTTMVMNIWVAANTIRYRLTAESSSNHHRPNLMS
jgi:hypothetical protein